MTILGVDNSMLPHTVKSVERQTHMYMAEEKFGCLRTSNQPRGFSRWRRYFSVAFKLCWTVAVVFIGACIIFPGHLARFSDLLHGFPVPGNQHKDGREERGCPQPRLLFPTHTSDALENMTNYFTSKEFEKESILRLSRAIQLPTESYDDMGDIGKDKRWNIMFDFAAYLEATFPHVYKVLQVETVNVHGLLYTWTGTNKTLKPTLLMAHQDVVPVAPATVDSWTYPPFSGHYDGKYIWGRGSSDCKNSLIAIMEVIEALLVSDFRPQRTIVLAFGFDEEISGRQGAGRLAPFLLDRYGKDSFATIVDEGAGVSEQWGKLMATPGVAEKGYTDVTITIRMPGGHSSIPPPHTSIGVLSELIVLVEADMYPTWLDTSNPYRSQLQCGNAYSPTFPKKLRHLLEHERSHSRQCAVAKKSHKHDRLAQEAAKAGLAERYLMQTSIAVDVIGGGVKVNALPERVSVVVNHRINIGERAADVHVKLTRLAGKIAKKHGLALHAFDGNETASAIMLADASTTLEPAPVTPTRVDELSAYSILAGTTRALYGEDMVVSPGIMTGNTDTRYYWDLSRNIFRYAPGWERGEEGLGRIHTVDERISAGVHVATVRWYWLFVRNMDTAKLA